MGKQLTLLLTWCDQLLVHVPVEDRSCYLGQGRISVRYGGALRRNPHMRPVGYFSPRLRLGPALRMANGP
jgi:hypothetical protein